MEDFISRLYDAVVSRLHGPMKFRFVMQPLVAAIFAVRAGLGDAKHGRAPFLWSIFTVPESRSYLIKDGWKNVAKVFTVATVMDLVYQYIELGRMRPLRALLVAAVLCFIPYLLIRGPVNRLARRSKA
jgi:hypothetical protein